VLQAALKNNSSLQSAEEKLKAAEAENKSAHSILNSKISGELAWQDEELSDEGDFITSLNYSKLIAKSKGTKAQLEAADIKLIQAGLDYSQSRDQILKQVIQQYYILLKNQELIAKQELRIKEAEALYEDAVLRYEDSFLTKAGLLELEINLDKSRQNLENLQNEKNTNQEKLTRLSGLKTEKLNIIAEKLPIEEYNLNDSQDILKLALNNRSDYQKALLNSNILEMNINYLESGKSPDLSLKGEYNFDDGKVETSFNSDYQLNLKTSLDTIDREQMYISVKDMQLFEESEWKVIAAVSYEFSDGGRKEADIKAVESNLRANEIRTADLENEIEIKIKEELRNLASNRNRIIIARKYLKKARLEYQSTENRFRQGAVTESAVISARRLLKEAESEKIEAQYDYEINMAELLAEMQIIYQKLVNSETGGDFE
jgi:outer membrane protein TolC